jgi:AGCS family alanine or glycine:cation symporter
MEIVLKQLLNERLLLCIGGNMSEIVALLNNVVWGIPTLLLILGVGVFISIQTRFVQIRLLPASLHSFIRRFFERRDVDGVSSYRALCTALAATVGTGNIAGVAGAIAIGGPGAVFWMWVCAFLGMGIKYAEATLAVRFRRRNSSGEYVGGTMHMIERTMPRFRWLAILYCFFGVVAAFGVGNATQINSVIGSINGVISYLGGNPGKTHNILLGAVLAVIILYMLLGGAGRIGAIAEGLVPYAACGYLLLCALVLLMRIHELPEAFSAIVNGALYPKAVTGGMVGSVFFALRIGASRGVFTNEAGMGTAAIAHAASNVKHPVEQGMMGIVEVFLDTIVICTMTALVILCSGTSIQYGVDSGIHLTVQAFSEALGDWVCIPIALFMCCFALATILGWGLYGIRCAQFLFGSGCWKSFAYTQAITAIISSVLGTATVWSLAEMVNGLMAIPNLIVLAYLTPELKRLSTQYMHYKMRTPLTNGAFKC